MNMYVCPECRKAFKVKSSNKQIKCPKCPDAILSDMKIDAEEWGKINNDTKNAIIDANLNTSKDKLDAIYIPFSEEGISTEEKINRLEKEANDVNLETRKSNQAILPNISIKGWVGIVIGIFILGYIISTGQGCSTNNNRSGYSADAKKEVRCAKCGKVIWNNGKPIHCSHEFLNTYKCSYCGFKNVIN